MKDRERERERECESGREAPRLHQPFAKGGMVQAYVSLKLNHQLLNLTRLMSIALYIIRQEDLFLTARRQHLVMPEAKLDKN